MKTILILITVITTSFCLRAQTIEYTYDAAGNRVTRQVIYLSQDNNMKSLQASAENKEKEEAPVQEYLQEQTGEMQVKIYPNPTDGELKVAVSGAENTPSGMEISIYEITGKKIFTGKQYGTPAIIDLSGHPKGVYILEVVTGGERSEWKVVKE